MKWHSGARLLALAGLLAFTGGCGRESKVRAVSLATHNLPPAGSCFTFERSLADTILSALQ